MRFPIGVLELVLDVKHPYAHGPGDAGDDGLGDEVMNGSEGPAEQEDHREDGQVHIPDGAALAAVGAAFRKTLADDEEKEWGDDEKDDGIPRELVGKALPAGG